MPLKAFLLAMTLVLNCKPINKDNNTLGAKYTLSQEHYSAAVATNVELSPEDSQRIYQLLESQEIKKDEKQMTMGTQVVTTFAVSDINCSVHAATPDQNSCQALNLLDKDESDQTKSVALNPNFIDELLNNQRVISSFSKIDAGDNLYVYQAQNIYCAKTSVGSFKEGALSSTESFSCTINKVN